MMTLLGFITTTAGRLYRRRFPDRALKNHLRKSLYVHAEDENVMEVSYPGRRTFQYCNRTRSFFRRRLQIQSYFAR